MTEEENKGDPIWISMEAFLAQKVSPTAVVLAIELIGSVYMPAQQAFEFAPKGLAAILAPHHRAAEDLETRLIEHRDELSVFFTILPDGRWVPSPEFFSMTDANAESRN